MGYSPQGHKELGKTEHPHAKKTRRCKYPTLLASQAHPSWQALGLPFPLSAAPDVSNSPYVLFSSAYLPNSKENSVNTLSTIRIILEI